MIFNTDSQYVDMNVGTHRRPPPLMGAPGLVWHRAFWKPGSGESASPSALRKTEEKWHQSIDALLHRLFLRLQQVSGSSLNCPNCDDRLYLFRHSVDLRAAGGKLEPLLDERTVRHDVFACQAVAFGLNLTVRATLQLEYWTLSMYADFAFREDETPAANTSTAPLRKMLDDLATVAIDRSRELFRGVKPSTGAPPTMRQVLVDGFSDFIHGEILAFAPDDALAASGKFADFFGVVLGLSPVREGESYALARVLRRRAETMIQQMGHSRFDATTGLISLDAIWPIVRGFDLTASTEPQKHGKSEYTASLFQRGRALYVSSLGRFLNAQEEKDVREGDPYDPLIFVLVSIHNSRWQLGRLVDRVTTMGTLRLAAVRDIRELSKADADIRRIGAEVSLNRDHRQRASLTKDFDKVGARLDHGLVDRVNRSRYYVATFRDLLSHLDVQRVEGFPQYDEFLRRRLFDTFDFIDRLGRRYVELQNRLSASAEIQRRNLLVEIQRGAEIVVPFPVAYYVAGIVSDLIPGDRDLVWSNLAGVLVGIGIFGYLRRESLSRFTNSKLTKRGATVLPRPHGAEQ